VIGRSKLNGTKKEWVHAAYVQVALSVLKPLLLQYHAFNEVIRTRHGAVISGGRASKSHIQTVSVRMPQYLMVAVRNR
jgi:hypothetical protein